MKTLWVLSCGKNPYSWNEDKQLLMDSVSKSFPEKRWQQINELVWETTDNSWSIVSIDKQEQ